MQFRQITFNHLIFQLAERIGHHHLPFNHRAGDYHEILLDGAVHESLVKTLVRKIYRQNRCSSLNSDVDPETVYKVLGSTRWEMIKTEHADLEAVSLIDRIGECLGEMVEIPAADSGTGGIEPEVNRPDNPEFDHPRSGPARPGNVVRLAPR